MELEQHGLYSQLCMCKHPVDFCIVNEIWNQAASILIKILFVALNFTLAHWCKKKVLKFFCFVEGKTHALIYMSVELIFLHKILLTNPACAKIRNLV